MSVQHLPSSRPSPLGVAADASWAVPLEIALALPTSAAAATRTRERLALGELAMPQARILLRRDRFITAIDFAGPGRRSLVFAVDVWARDPTR